MPYILLLFCTAGDNVLGKAPETLVHHFGSGGKGGAHIVLVGGAKGLTGGNGNLNIICGREIEKDLI